MTEDQRLAKIEAQQERVLVLVESLTRKMDERQAASDAWRTRIDRSLFGDGNGTAGLMVRIDRLEQAQERQKWLVRVIAGAVVTLGLTALKAMLSL